MGCTKNAKSAREVNKYYGNVLSPKVLKKADWERDCLTREFFTPNYCFVDWVRGNKTGLKKILGKSPNVEQMAGLFAGGLDKSQIKIIQDGNHISISVENDFFDRPLELVISHDSYSGERRMVLKDIFLKESAPPTMGTRIFANIVAQAQAFGVSEISCFGAKSVMNGKGETVEGNGYYTWARLGFDTSLDVIRNGCHLQIPAEFQHCEYLSEIMETENGRKWWRENGKDVTLRFSLEKGSPHLVRLTNYLKEKEILI